MWSSPTDRRRSARICSTVSCWPSTTRRRPDIRVAASATECASVAPVLRPCTVANTRVRAGQLARHIHHMFSRGQQSDAPPPPAPGYPGAGYARRPSRRNRGAGHACPAACGGTPRPPHAEQDHHHKVSTIRGNRHLLGSAALCRSLGVCQMAARCRAESAGMIIATNQLSSCYSDLFMIGSQSGDLSLR